MAPPGGIVQMSLKFLKEHAFRPLKNGEIRIKIDLTSGDNIAI